MPKIVSPDGTHIAYRLMGAGPPLVLVHGTGAASPTAWPAFPMLAKHFALYAVDRRGCRASGDGESYAVEREFEDVAAVVDSIGEPANLLGHSYGGLCALGASLLTQNIRKLILYEPALRLGTESVNPEGVREQIEALLDAGDREAAWVTYMRDVAMLSPQDIEWFRASPAWAERLAAAHTLPREMRAEEQYRFDAGRFRALHTPTLLLLGSDSPPFARTATEALGAALPNSRITVMPEQEHIAMYAAPDLFVHEVLSFLSEPQ